MTKSNMPRVVKPTITVIGLIIAALGTWWLVLKAEAIKEEEILSGFGENHNLQLEKETVYSAANRFLPYAYMSSHAYCIEDSTGAEANGWRGKREKIRKKLLKNWHWIFVEELNTQEDECPQGFYSEVWRQEKGNGPRKVVVAFRGTKGWRDWVTNFVQPFEHFFGVAHTMTKKRVEQFKGVLFDDPSTILKTNDVSQKEGEVCRANVNSGFPVKHYPAAVDRIVEVNNYFANRRRTNWESDELDIYTTGHSLGAGLAEYTLYNCPNTVRQAIGFNPTPVSGYSSVGVDNQKDACRCRFRRDSENISYEPRVYRIFESGEALVRLREEKKRLKHRTEHIPAARFIFGASNVRFVHEIRLDYIPEDTDPVSAHSIKTFVERLEKDSESSPKGLKYWYQTEGSEEFVQSHVKNCDDAKTDESVACNLSGQ